MQRLNVHDYYELGKKIAELEKQIGNAAEESVRKSAIAWPLFTLRWTFEDLLKEPCALLTASQRSAKAVIKSITSLLPVELADIFNSDEEEFFQTYELRSVTTAFTNFETVLKNDMPEMSTFAVAQIGILRTDDLINNAHRQIAEPLQILIERKAKQDIIEAGKCLAFQLSTASAFHVCRAIETGIDQYYEAVTGSPYPVSASGGNNNWGAKIGALESAGADKKVTELLNHIRKQYRNPVAHPEVTVEEYEAVDLFITALSAISMMLGATKALTVNPEDDLPLIAAPTATLKKLLGSK